VLNVGDDDVVVFVCVFCDICSSMRSQSAHTRNMQL